PDRSLPRRSTSRRSASDRSASTSLRSRSTCLRRSAPTIVTPHQEPPSTVSGVSEHRTKLLPSRRQPTSVAPKKEVVLNEQAVKDDCWCTEALNRTCSKEHPSNRQPWVCASVRSTSTKVQSR